MRADAVRRIHVRGFVGKSIPAGLTALGMWAAKSDKPGGPTINEGRRDVCAAGHGY